MDGTYTKYLLDTLGQKPVLLIFRGKPMVLGGPTSVTAHIKKRALARTVLESNSILITVLIETGSINWFQLCHGEDDELDQDCQEHHPHRVPQFWCVVQPLPVHLLGQGEVQENAQIHV